MGHTRGAGSTGFRLFAGRGVGYNEGAIRGGQVPLVTKEFVASVDLFAGLAAPDAEALAALGREEVFRKGQAIFRERDPGDRVYVVVSGVVEVTRSAPGVDRPTPVARLERGEAFGETSALEGTPRAATASAAVVPETRVVSWDSGELRRFLAERPGASAAFLQALALRLHARLRQASEALQALLRTL